MRERRERVMERGERERKRGTVPKTISIIIRIDTYCQKKKKLETKLRWWKSTGQHT